MRNLVVLEDGTEIFSGGEGSAVMAVEVTHSVNLGTQLAPGAVCAAMVQLKLLDMGDLQLDAGAVLTLYRVDDAGQRTRVGTFLAEEPVRKGRLLTLVGYDRLVLLDRDLTAWLRQCNGWPYSLQEFARMVCEECGLVLAEQTLPNGELSVERFTADGVTGRQLLSWVAEAAGCFCRLNALEQPELCWYTPAPVTVGPVEQAVKLTLGEEALALTLPEGVAYSQGTLALDSPYITCTAQGGTVYMTVYPSLVQQYYYQGALELADYRTAPIQRLQLRQNDGDVGTFWPDAAEGNTLVITGNPLLAARDAQSLLPVAQTLFSRLEGSSYTPCTLQLPYTPGLQAGQLLTLFDTAGGSHTVYIMELSVSAKGMRICCTGTPERNSSLLTNSLTRALQGKVLQLRADVDGLQAENSDNAGRLAGLSLTVDAIRGKVTEQEGLRQRLSQLEQTADGVKLTVQTMTEQGTDKVKTAMGYTFDDRGLHIQGAGQQMENLLDSTGMYVSRNGQVILQANHAGVQAYDVTVGNYLVVGSHARLEDYGLGRTACFYIDGKG